MSLHFLLSRNRLHVEKGTNVLMQNICSSVPLQMEDYVRNPQTPKGNRKVLQGLSQLMTVQLDDATAPPSGFQRNISEKSLIPASEQITGSSLKGRILR